MKHLAEYRDTDTARRLAAEIGASFVPDAEAAVRGADVVACCTAATIPCTDPPLSRSTKGYMPLKKLSPMWITSLSAK